MNLNDLSPELLERVKAAKTPEDILALAQEVGYELSDEELTIIAGGGPGSSAVREDVKDVDKAGWI